MPAQNNYSSYDRGLTAPAADAFAITPGPGELPVVARALYVGGGGNVEIDTLAGTTVVFANVPAGTTVACSATRVRSANTTATQILGLV